MIAQIPVLLVGLLISVMGIINMTGNINSLHSYHRHRVKEEDRVPFGRMVGGGTLTVGVGVIVFSVLIMIYDATAAQPLVWIGVGVMLTCIIVGLAISFWGMFKYNKGIF
jgi:uncharacterized PurR-regulated membrane protein YhhQ (DUF165 family)